MRDAERTEYFAGQLKTAIKESNLSIKEIAAKSGLSEIIIMQWRQGKILPKIKSLVKLSKALDKNVSWFIDK